MASKTTFQDPENLLAVEEGEEEPVAAVNDSDSQSLLAESEASEGGDVLNLDIDQEDRFFDSEDEEADTVPTESQSAASLNFRPRAPKRVRGAFKNSPGKKSKTVKGQSVAERIYLKSTSQLGDMFQTPATPPFNPFSFQPPRILLPVRTNPIPFSARVDAPLSHFRVSYH